MRRLKRAQQAEAAAPSPPSGTAWTVGERVRRQTRTRFVWLNGIIVTMVLELEEFEPAVQKRAGRWAALGLRHRVLPIHPNHGKPVTSAWFESAEWRVEVTIWSSGEADLSTLRLTDDRNVNKHYDLADRKDLDGLLDELVRLLADDELPRSSVVFKWPGTPS